MKIILTCQLPKSGLDLLEGYELIQDTSVPAASKEWVLDNCRGVDAVITTLTCPVDQDVVNAAGPSLKVVSTFSAGYDHIDLAVLKKHNIRLGTTAGVLTDAVADLTACLTIATMRRMVESYRAILDDQVRAAIITGYYPNLSDSVAKTSVVSYALCRTEFKGKTVGFLGFGQIAQATLVRLLPFGVKRCLYSTSRPGQPTTKDYQNLLKDCPISIEPATLKDLAENSDVVIVTCSLNKQTTGLVNSEFFKNMRDTSYIINIARGPIIDNDDLLEALERKQIAGAGLDVIKGEPNLLSTHPLVQHINCTILPHIGSATIETRNEMARLTAANCVAGLKGEKMEAELDF